MGQIACSKHNNAAVDLRNTCVDCLRAERDFLLEEVGTLIACIETPHSKATEVAKAFVQKMVDRGVERIDHQAVRYHLALLILPMFKE